MNVEAIPSSSWVKTRVINGTMTVPMISEITFATVFQIAVFMVFFVSVASEVINTPTLYLAALALRNVLPSHR